MKAETKRKIADKLVHYPFLRVLLFEVWFRVAVILLLILGIGMALGLAKVWKTSPPGYLPIVKVSGLDLIQAWSLKRNAIRAEEGGNHEEAAQGWMLASANNPADPELIRGMLRSMLREEKGKYSRLGVFYSLRLLKLTSTNLSDLELTSEVLEKGGAFDLCASLLEERKDQLTPKLEESLLRSLFHMGRISAFAERLNEVKEKIAPGDGVSLYRAAYVAGWGAPGGAQDAARAEILKAFDDPGQRLLAARLYLAVSAFRSDLESYEMGLRKLEEWQADTLLYHVGYSRLLAARGRKEEALNLIETASRRPVNEAEVLDLSRFYGLVGRPEMAVEVLRQVGSDYSFSPAYWMELSKLLLEQKKWDELRQAAIQMRTVDSVGQRLAGYSYYLQGQAEIGLGRTADAERSMERLAEAEFSVPSLGLLAASELAETRYAETSKKVLAKLEDKMESDPKYWTALFGAANYLKDVDLMLKSSEQAHRLRPNDPIMMNNYAASLILKREKAEEVDRITLQLVVQRPDSLPSIINRSAALTLNRRWQEAERLLGRVPADRLTPPQAALYYFNLFEIYRGMGRWDEARRISERIEAHFLYPPQRAWLEQTFQELKQKIDHG